jgi:hypothetical protein
MYECFVETSDITTDRVNMGIILGHSSNLKVLLHSADRTTQNV